MTASTMDTAELPRTGIEANVSRVEAPGTVGPRGAGSLHVVTRDALRASIVEPVPPPPPADRRARREERRHLRRQQQRYALAAVALLAALFLAAVIVLGGIR